MSLLTISLTVLEIVAFLFGVVVLGFAVYFFIASRRSLRQAMESSHQKTSLQSTRSTVSSPALPKRSAAGLMQGLSQKIKKRNIVEEPELPVFAKTKPLPKEESIESLKQTVFEQQKLLNGFLRQVEEIENEGREELELRNKELQNEIEDLKAGLDEKDAALEQVKQQAALSERMAAKIEEVYQEFEQLQTKMISLEKQAGRANRLAIELEDTRQSYEQVHKDLQRKTEKLEEAYLEMQSLQQQLNTMEDKFAEANLQRQQLQKKVQFLQDLNNDLQTVSDTNKKLQTELRRIGELESMLNMIAEERDNLLRKRTNK